MGATLIFVAEDGRWGRCPPPGDDTRVVERENGAVGDPNLEEASDE